MYKVYYYLGGGSQVTHKVFDSLREATEFATKQPIDSVLEIKRYDYKASNIQD
jgi:hypothetical protein